VKLRIKDWNKFQHFKDRRPPWIKLYRDLLDDMDWHELDGDSAKALVSLWLIASENEGQLPDMKKLAFRLRMTEKAVTAICNNLSHWLERVDDTAISERHQGDAPETETETETETEQYCPEKAPDGFEEFWKAYPRTPNMSKSAALKAWQKQKPNLPPTDQLLVSVAKYRAFLAAETKKNGREYPAKHAQGWLNEQRWLGFMADIPGIDAPKHSADWADAVPEWSQFKASLPPAAWSAFFAGCRPNGSISTLIAPSTFVMEQIEARYGQALDAIFNGQFNVKFEARN